MNPLETSPAMPLGGSHLSSLKGLYYTATEVSHSLGHPGLCGWARASCKCHHSTWLRHPEQHTPLIANIPALRSYLTWAQGPGSKAGFLASFILTSRRLKLASPLAFFSESMWTLQCLCTKGAAQGSWHSQGPFIGYFKLTIQSSIQTRKTLRSVSRLQFHYSAFKTLIINTFMFSKHRWLRKKTTKCILYTWNQHADWNAER